MAIAIKNRVYRNQFTADEVDYLIGNVGDWQRLEFEAHCSVNYIATSKNLVQMDGGRLILSDGSTWAEWGFKLGDLIHITYRYRYTPDSTDNDVDTVYYIVEQEGDTVLTNSLADGSGVPFLGLEDAGITTLPYNDNEQKVTQVEIYSDKRIEGASLLYSHIKNSDSDTGLLNSVIDGTETAFVSENMGTAPALTPQSVKVIGFQSGMSIDSVKYEYIEKQGTHTYVFKYTIDYLVSGFFEEVENYEEKFTPEYLAGTESLTDNIKINGQIEFNNPNYSIVNKTNSTKQKGNTGWFDENYNGYDNNMSVKSVDYVDALSLEPVDSLSYSSDTIVTIKIEGIQNLTLNQTKILLGFQWVTSDETFWTKKDTPYHQNTLINTAKGAFGNSAIIVDGITDISTYQGFTSYDDARMDIKDITADLDGTDLVVTATYSPTASFLTFMESQDETERNYSLFVSIGDYTKSVSNSDRVTLLVDYNTLAEVIAPAGEWEGMQLLNFTHQFDGGDDSNSSDEDYYIEDDILAKIYFGVDVTDVVPLNIRFAVEVEKTDGDVFDLQSYSADLSSFPTDSNGVPQFDFDESRGFKYKDGNNKNWVKVNRNPDNDSAPDYGYVAYFGYKIRWEDWIKRIGVPSDFFDNTKKNNGFNNDWYHYLNTSNWQTKFVVYIQAEKDGETVEYRNAFDINFADYESEDNITSEFTYKRYSDGQDIGKSILNDELTLIEVVHTLVAGEWGSIDDVYGTVCIEVNDGAGQFSFRQTSTIWEKESDSPFVSLLENKLLKKELISPNQVKLSTLIDPIKLDQGSKYKITSRIGTI